MKRWITLIAVALSFFLSISFLYSKGKSVGDFNGGKRTSQVMAQELVMQAGDRLMEKGLYLEALQKYDEALQPEYIEKKNDAAGPIYRKVRFYRVVGQYDKALEQLDVFKQYSLKPENLNEERDELTALSEFKNTSNLQSVYIYIQKYLRENSDWFPPKTIEGRYISVVVRLYDTIGDYDAGIAFVNECISYFRNNKLYEGDAFVEPIEFVKIREAFEQDKAEGKNGCVGKKPGEVCLGRATKAIIQSDYFPW